MPKPKRIEIYDTTLRDGSQSEGISYTVSDKLRIAERLDDFGVTFIEGGWPGSNPKDIAFFREVKKLRLKHAQITSFGSTRRVKTDPAKDPNLSALVDSGTRFVTIFGKTWDLHVTKALKTTLDENLKMIESSILFLRKHHKEVIYDAEHFFDGYRSNPAYALKTLECAAAAGARTLVLCDTNGGTLPETVKVAMYEVRKRLKTPLGIHTHNDGGLAVANSLAAIEAGANHVQGTINGIGERCGNPDLATIIPNLELKMGYTCLPAGRLKRLTELSRFVGEVGNMMLQDNQPYVGKSAFAHKGGVHINAMLKSAKTYEHITPESVGNVRRFLTSELSGKTHIQLKAKSFNIALSRKSKKAQEILKLLQKLENEGYQFEAAEASFELMIHKLTRDYKPKFELLDFRVIVTPGDHHKLESEATIHLKVGQREEHSAALGDGPVNALDNALRKALLPFYPKLKTMHLSDFKVRVLDQKSGTAAKVRVFIESRDEKGSWTTVGISENIIEACWKALVDSVEYKLLRDARA